MKFLIPIFAFSFSLFACARPMRAHDIHISYSQAELKGGELFVKVSYYKDDFTKAVKNWYGAKADNLSPQEFQNAEFEYVKNFFRVWAGNYSAQVMPVLLKLTDDGTSIIFEIKFSSASPTSLIIDQRVLFKEYGDQMNIFFIKAFSKEDNHIFTASKPTLIIKP
ncbi:MAG: DUF6702 family protein [Candidatus Kapaibacterium sp.]